ncbi:hypothetical protein RclHR1_00290027 [Rhizophagus clarus]|uniref:Protein kinase domain-containing protein n=1 Tax=Rhizophagus clarus TaxID=94130 RepID=A0A2Z6RIB4_9GLOM|nr:hypothetical protein RclHR1_00290027 [Rhizophagus clarus]
MGFEWIPYDQFDDVKEISKNNLVISYSAMWKNGPLYWRSWNEYKRVPYKTVVLKYLGNSQNITEKSLNKNIYSVKNFGLNIYGISQNPITKDYFMVLNLTKYCVKCDKMYTNELYKWYRGGFGTVYSATWKDGQLGHYKDKNEWIREPDRKVALKCLYNSQYTNNLFLNEVKAYSINNFDKILKVYGISQHPDTKDYIIVLQYAEDRNFSYWLNNNSKYFNWFIKSKVLNMGLCGEIGDIDDTNIYGVMPYVAPEVLRGNPYSQAADIYGFSMIMYFVATGRQPFASFAHDHHLALDTVYVKELDPT